MTESEKRLSLGLRVIGRCFVTSANRQPRWLLPCWLVIVLACLGASVIGEEPSPPAGQKSAITKKKTANEKAADSEARPDDFRVHLVPLLRKYCYECHGEKKQESDIALHTMTSEAAALTKRSVWEAVLTMIEGRAMPPANHPQPTAAERQQMVRWLESTLFDLDCEQQHDPGRVTIRRLNRIEYNNTIRDLLGVDFRPADDFPSDDVGYGFDNIGDVLSVSPLLVEKYLTSAERIAAAAVSANVVAKPVVERRQGKDLKAGGQATLTFFGHYNLMEAGSLTASFAPSVKGAYLVKVRAAASRAGDELAQMQVTVGREPPAKIEIDAMPDKPKDYTVRVRLEPGDHEVKIEFTNHFVEAEAKDGRKRERRLFVSRVELEGPLSAPPKNNAVGGGLVIVEPGSGKTVRDAARETLAPLVRRAFRRAVGDEDLEKYLKLVEIARGRDDSYERAIEVALTALLVSPEFLFRYEGDRDPNNPATKHEITDFELATRLSYFIWSSMPDDELLEVAERGELRQPNVLAAQTRRLLADKKSLALAENFASQWLNLRGLEEVTPDSNRFAGFNPAVKQDLRKETELLFDTVLREQRSIFDFLTADFTFLNERLAKFYGMEGIKGGQFRRVSLEGTPRLGVLTHGSVLTLTSNPTRTSPVKRGKWIMENILGTPPPDPPANVPELVEAPQDQPDSSLRKQMEIHRANPQCAVCHVTMDQLGFGFENFDAVGRWRDQDGKQAIDASGELPDGSKFSGPRELVTILTRKKAEFSRTLTERMLTYSLGRGLEFTDRCAVDAIVKEMERHEYQLQALVLAIVQSDPFRLRQPEAAAPAGDEGERK